MIGETILHYRIEAKLGEGGMGEVFLATDTRLDRKVALKFLPPHSATDPESKTRFEHEAKAAAAPRHANIITIHELAEHEGRLLLVMEHVEGPTLAEYCRKEDPSVEQILDLTIQIAQGLQKAHEAGVVHRDLKPTNILIDSDGQARILDFGLAKLKGASKLTKTGSTLGTAAYMSPEQSQGRKVDHRTDIWSLGVILYEMLAQRLPFDAEHGAALAYAISHEEPEPLARYKVGVTDDMQRIVSKCLAKAPDERYQHVDELVADLKRHTRQSETRTAASVSEQSPVRPSIAVLPFVNMSDDGANEYFSDGLTEELINSLARIPELHVAARTSSFQLKGKTGAIESIGRQLGVTRVLEGSVRKAGRRVRITAQLISVSDGFHLWSETYDRDLEDIFAVQDAISQSVTEALKVVLTAGDQTTASPQAHNAEAYNLVLQARYFRQRATKDGCEKAINYCRQAITIAPDYAPAWATLARTYETQRAWAYSSPDENTAAALEAAERAVALDDGLAEAHMALSETKLSCSFDLRGASADLKRARDLEPNNATFLGSAAGLAGAVGRIDEAIDLSLQGVRLDPLNHGAYHALGLWLLFAGRLGEAERALEKALELYPALPVARYFLGQVYLLRKELTHALQEMQNEPHASFQLAGSALVFHAMGREELANEAVQKLVEDQGMSYQVAEIHAYRGALNEAFEWLERSRVELDSGVYWAKADPLLRNLHQDPRWVEFLGRIGLAD